jgi:hypothetical protein
MLALTNDLSVLALGRGSSRAGLNGDDSVKLNTTIHKMDFLHHYEACFASGRSEGTEACLADGA